MKEEMIKISMPLFDNIELQSIDTFYNDIVDEYTKAYVKEKEQVIIQQIMKNLREENKSLQSQLKAKEDNWNMLKEHLKNRYDNGTESISYRQVFMEIREMMKELEQGSDRNE